MIIDFDSLSPASIYHCVTQSLIPRPVAWALTENPGGDYNLAPFSYFTAVSSEPPLVLLSMGKKPDGTVKDTRNNILARKHFVIHIAHREMAQAMTETSRTLPLGESELALADLPTVPFDGFPVPRLRDCRVAMACEFYDIKEIGPNAQGLIFARIRHLYLDDSVVTEEADGRLKIDATAVDPLGRLGASEYATLGEILHVPRPK